MKLLFVNLSSLQFTVATPDYAPLGGSESSVCYLARALARRGHDVSLLAHLPAHTDPVIDAIHHYPLATFQDQDFLASARYDAIILCNASAAAEPLKQLVPSAQILLWAHILPDQPAVQNLAREKEFLDGIVFVSKWQQAEVERVFGSFRAATVIGNGIAPAFEDMFASPAELLAGKKNRGAYTTTPYRGLSVLLRAMEGLERETKIDLFSSMRVYQGDDKEYADLFHAVQKNPVFINHGSVTQSELAQHLRADAFLFYPSIYPETFCITAAEAMAAGMHIITTYTGALPETTMGMGDLVAITSTDGAVLVNDFRAAMRRAIDGFLGNPDRWATIMFERMQYANEVFRWDKRAEAWENYFKVRSER